MSNRLLMACITLAVSSLALAGCAAGTDAPGSPAGGPRIVTTTTQVTDFTRIVTEGTGAQITPLLQSGQSAHHFEADAAQLTALAQADAIVMSGAGLESWLDATIQASGFDGQIIDASAGIELSGAADDHDHGASPEGTDGTGAGDHSHDHDHGAGTGDGHDHGDEHDHGAAETTSPGPEASTEGHEGHDHAGGNPHIWTSPENARVMVRNIADGIAGLGGVDGASLTSNAEAYDAKLAQLDEWISGSIKAVPQAKRLLVTNHDGLHYYNEAYGITFIGSIIPSWDDNAEPSAADLAQLAEEIKARGVPAIFTETQLSPQAADAIAAQAGVKVYSGDAALYTDSLGADGTPGASYIGATIHNTQQLMDSWGAAASEVPSELAA